MASEQAAVPLTSEARREVERLARAVLALKPLAGALGRPVRIAPVAGDPAAPRIPAGWEPSLLGRLTARFGMPRLEWSPGLTLADLDVFERAASLALAIRAADEPAAAVPAEALAAVGEIVDEIADQALAESLPREAAHAEIRSFDGALVRAYALGERHRPPVVLTSACGGPVELSELWVRRLAQDYFVVTVETRGLFGEVADFDRLGQDVPAQAADVFAAMDHFGVASGHLMGMCGGAVVALDAAAQRPDRITSLSLWYGDYDLGPGTPKTIYQKDLKDFLSMAGEDRTIAASLRTVFCRSLLNNPLPDLAHLTLYPYASDELLFRYGRLNGSIMEIDVRPLLARVTRPALVVTSQDDTKAHPEGSRLVAARLPQARLHVEPHGDHITLFHADPGITELAARFIAEAAG